MPAPENPWIVVTIGAPHCQRRREGQPVELVVHEIEVGREIERMRDVQRLPDPAVHARVLGIAVRHDRFEVRRGHRVGGGEEGDLDAHAARVPRCRRLVTRSHGP